MIDEWIGGEKGIWFVTADTTQYRCVCSMAFMVYDICYVREYGYGPSG